MAGVPHTAGRNQLLGQEGGEDSGFRRGLQQLADVREGDDNEEYGAVYDDGVEEGGTEADGAAADKEEEGEVLGFKSSLPPNPFGY